MKRERVYREFRVYLKADEYSEEYTSRGWIDITSVESVFIDDEDRVILETECDNYPVSNSIEEVLEKLNVSSV